MDSHEAYKELRNALKEKYKKVTDVMAEEFPTYTEDDLFDRFFAVCRGGHDGVKEVRIEDGKVILTYAEGVEVDFDELKKEYAELKGFSDENATEAGLI